MIGEAKKMIENPIISREPELKEFGMVYENQLNRMDTLTFDLRSKVKQIHNPPQLDQPFAIKEYAVEEKQNDAISDLHSKNDRLEMFNHRLEDILIALNRII